MVTASSGIDSRSRTATSMTSRRVSYRAAMARGIRLSVELLTVAVPSSARNSEPSCSVMTASARVITRAIFGV